MEGPSHDILFAGSSSRRNVFTGDEYWNGDGFKAERETRRIRWINCSAFDNGDAGFDIKTPSAYLENVIALRNKRNIRIWHREGATLKNINASFSVSRGGIGFEAGLWARGLINCYHCTLHNNEIQAFVEDGPEPAMIRLYDSILSLDGSREGVLIRGGGNSRVKLIRTAVWHEGVTGLNPLYEQIHSLSDGEAGTFYSKRYKNQKGYVHKDDVLSLPMISGGKGAGAFY